ncbi:hypothetical protein LPJ76_005924 [Coemansia sp. RSA 638]|nr:hypothetical protein LPJ76_005924 [Coemansia sp. RSA 638]
MNSLRFARVVVVKHSIEGIRTLGHSLSLLEHMKKYGTVTSFKFMRDPVNNERSGMAFVSYLHYDDAKAALALREQTVVDEAAVRDIEERIERLVDKYSDYDWQSMLANTQYCCEADALLDEYGSALDVCLVSGPR